MNELVAYYNLRHAHFHGEPWPIDEDTPMQLGDILVWDNGSYGVLSSGGVGRTPKSIMGWYGEHERLDPAVEMCGNAVHFVAVLRDCNQYYILDMDDRLSVGDLIVVSEYENWFVGEMSAGRLVGESLDEWGALIALRRFE